MEDYYRTCSKKGEQKENTQWWKVDLELPYQIFYINIHHQSDCDQMLLNGATVYLDTDKLCTIKVDDAAVSKHTVQCDGIYGQIVEIKLTTGTPLHITEVEVMSNG